MDSSRFDAWTRRRVTLNAGGLSLALFNAASMDVAEAKKKKKKRCKKLGEICTQGGRKCCGKLRCDTHGENDVDQTFCCKSGGNSCSTPNDCCSPFGCNPGTKRCEVP